jgi:hypothetical protein
MLLPKKRTPIRMQIHSIAIPAPTLEAFLGSREKAHELLYARGFAEIIDVTPYFIQTIKGTAELARAAGAPRVSPACPRARAFCAGRSRAELIARLPSPAALAVRETANSRKSAGEVQITFISPCPHKARELQALNLPAGVTLKILTLTSLLAGQRFAAGAAEKLNAALTLPDIGMPLLQLRGEEEARRYLSDRLDDAPACVDLQMCTGGCLGGGWCPRKKEE